MKLAILVLVLSLPVIAQKPTITQVPRLERPPEPTAPPCPLTIGQSPSWGKIKLGMSETDFQKLFPRMPFVVNKIDLPEDPAFDKVDNMMFTFYRERLEELTVQFDLSVHWDNIGKFTDDLSDTLKLPKLWSFSVGTGMLECKDFNVRAVSSRNEIKLRDTVAAKKMQAENALPPPADKTPKQKPPF